MVMSTPVSVSPAGIVKGMQVYTTPLSTGIVVVPGGFVLTAGSVPAVRLHVPAMVAAFRAVIQNRATISRPKSFFVMLLSSFLRTKMNSALDRDDRTFKYNTTASHACFAPIRVGIHDSQV